MAVTTPPRPPVELDDGVIEEARRRQRRRRAGAGGLLAAGAILIAILAIVLGGGGRRHEPSFPIRGPWRLTFVDGRPYLNGQLFPISVRPALYAGLVSLDIMNAGGGASAYPERGTPLFGAGQISGPPATVGGKEQCTSVGRRGPNGTPVPTGRRICMRVEGPVGSDGEVDYFLTEPQVTAVRVPGIGTLKPIALPGLPPGVRLVVFRRPPGSRGTVLPPDAKDTGLEHGLPEIVPVPLDAEGRPIPTTEPAAIGITLHSTVWQHDPATPARARCAMTSTARGARVLWGVLAAPIKPPDHWAVGPAFITCVETWYELRDGAAFHAAVLLNAQHPGSPPAPLWGATPVPGHQGLLHLNPVTYQQDKKRITIAPGMLARRDGNTWLVVANGTLTQELAFLDTLHITRRPA